jgi:hypothetical protein
MAASVKTAAASAFGVALLAGPAAAAGLEWKSGDLSLKAIGYVQGDVRAFPGWDVGPGIRDDGADVRRLRAGFEVESGPVYGEIALDAADLVNRALGDGDHRPAFTPRHHLKNAYVDLTVGDPLFLRVGNFKPPVSRELLTSAAKTDFVERTRLADNLAPDRDWGAMIGGKLGLAGGLNYMFGVFAGDGWSDRSRAGRTGAARLVFEPIDRLNLAVNGSVGTVKANPETAFGSEPKGLHGESVSDWNFFPRAYVDGQRRRLGADVQYGVGRVILKAEVLQTREERKGQGTLFEDLPAVVGLGMSASVEWHARGRRSKKDAASGRAALDLALRGESLRFDDEGGDLGPENPGTRAGNIRPRSIQALVAGVSWAPRPFARVMGSAAFERFGDALLAPESGRRGPYITLLGRLQLHVP